MSTETQEARTEKTAIALTPTEKIALKGVATRRGMPEAHLLREMLIGDIVDLHERMEYERLRKKHEAAA